MDTLSPAERSRVMSAIRSRDTAPEMIVRRALWAAGWRFRVCDWRVPGHPDIVIPKCRALIEIRGCFWHRHGWEPDGRKIVQRDAEHERVWAEEGWNVIVVWECGLKTASEREKTLRFVLRHLEKWAD